MPVARRTLLGAGLAAATGALTGCGDSGGTGPGGTGPGDAVTTTDAAGNRVGFGAAGNTPPGTPNASPSPGGGATAANQAKYAPQLTALLRRHLPASPQTVQHHGFPGAVAVVLVDGRTTVHTAVGEALRYAAGPKLLAAGQRVAMRPDSVFDLASVTKVYTAILLLQQVEKGRVDLGATVRDYLPGFTGAGKGPRSWSIRTAGSCSPCSPTGRTPTGPGRIPIPSAPLSATSSPQRSPERPSGPSAREGGRFPVAATSGGEADDSQAQPDD
ncbi:serine hydrolase domain-containing protein, partial [Micromonospora sp. NPDC049580]|uniref:serine hydrolase domain-containing protein n=1 Tax=Micromonospora sp. NPDC049580 TaxID=3154832 RepID=UPI00342C6AF3